MGSSNSGGDCFPPGEFSVPPAGGKKMSPFTFLVFFFLAPQEWFLLQSQKINTMTEPNEGTTAKEESSMLVESPGIPSEAEQTSQMLQLQKQMAVLQEAMKKQQAMMQRMKPIVGTPCSHPTSQLSNDFMEAETQKTTNSGVSSIGQSMTLNSNGAEVRFAAKGQFVTRQKNPRRRIVEKDPEEEKERQMAIFALKVTNGDIPKVRELQQRFIALHEVDIYRIWPRHKRFAAKVSTVPAMFRIKMSASNGCCVAKTAFPASFML